MVTIDKKQVSNYRARINKALASFSVGTDMFLQFEIDGMSSENKIFLQAALLDSRKPLSYPYLDAQIAKHAAALADLAKLSVTELLAR